MSLDVYLTLKGEQGIGTDSRIYIREGGQNIEISREEWDRRFPGREPATVEADPRDDTVFEYNITHNLSRMATQAGLHDFLWCPDEIGITKADGLIEPLRAGLALLQSDPDHFKAFNPSNGWGDYDGLVRFVDAYLRACEEWPDAEVYASR